MCAEYIQGRRLLASRPTLRSLLIRSRAYPSIRCLVSMGTYRTERPRRTNSLTCLPFLPHFAGHRNGRSLVCQIGACHGELSTWLRTHCLPTSLELSRDAFQDVMTAPEGPLIIIAAAQQNLNSKVQKTTWRRSRGPERPGPGGQRRMRLGRGLVRD